jgi:hypothetical protein
LPSETTETGAYFARGAVSTNVFAAISFPIPLPTEIASTKVKAVDFAKGTGTLEAGQKEVKSVVKTGQGNFSVGAGILGTGIPLGTTITACTPASCNNATTLTLSQEATASGTEVELTELVFAECENPAHSGEAGTGNPEADPGYLCVYAASGRPVAAAKPGGGQGAGLSGAFVSSINTSEENNSGTFAVTAP